MPDTFPVEYLVHFRYAGGIGSGFGMLIGYIACALKREAFKKIKWLFNVHEWITGFILFLSLLQFYNGYVESMRFDEYINGSISYTIPYIIIFVVSIIIHVLIYYKIAGNKLSLRER